MNKYIIRNCPAIQQGTCEKYGMCQDCTDCVTKQIVERCKDSMDYHSKDIYILGKTNMAGIVLALLQIEEVE